MVFDMFYKLNGHLAGINAAQIAIKSGVINSSEVTDVVIRLSAADIKLAVCRHAEFLASAGFDPRIAASQFVFTRAAHAFHDFSRAGVEHQAAGQNHAGGFFRAIG
jgi:hypothetical protein